MIDYNTFTSKILPFTLNREGGYANVSGDNGGETYRGISRRKWPNWSGWVTVDKVKPAHNKVIPELEEEVKRFYWQNFFSNRGFQHCNDHGTALALFDFAMNGGFSSVQFFTEFNKKFSKNIPVNSVVNAESLKLVNAANQKAVQKMIIAIRQNHFERLVKINPTQEKFQKGWNNRLAQMRTHLGISNRPPYMVLIIAVAVFLFCLYYF